MTEMPSRTQKPPNPPAISPRHQTALGALVIVLATFVAYGPALHGDLIWDDDAYVSANPLLVMPGGFWRLWALPPQTPQYYPLVFTSFWLEERLWGLSTFGLHVVNVALHAASALIFWHVLRRLGAPGAWLAGAIFALHPVHVESVAWITERKNVLSCFFYLLSFATYLDFHASRRKRLYLAAVLLFVCALLSKTVTCTLPVAILLCHWWRGEAINRRVVLPLVPFFVLGLVFGLTTAWLEKVHVRASGHEWDLSLVERVLVAGRALWFYAGKLFWPVDLVFSYPRWQIDAGAAWQFLFPGAFLILLFMLWRLRERIGSGPLAAVAFFAVTLVPALGFFDVYPFRFSFVADHFQYHASLGLIALAAAVLTASLRIPHSALRALAIVPISLGLLTYRQAGLYENIEVLWRRTIDANPDSWLARYNLGCLLIQRGEVTEAEEQYQRTLRINPQCADAYVSLGNIAGRRGEHQRAMTYYRAALDIDPGEPTAHYNMAKQLERAGDPAGAIAAYQDCLRNEPTSMDAHLNLGLVLLHLGRPDQAWDHFHEVLRYDPKNAAALHNLGMVLERDGKFTEAIAFYLRSLESDRALASAWYRIGVCWRKLGELEQAEAALRKTLELRADHVEAIADLAALHYDQGRTEDAIEGYERVLRHSPSDIHVRCNLSAALERVGRYADAAAALNAGLELQPEDLSLMHNLARLLATCPDVGVRDGPRALRLAQQLVQRLDPPRPEALATLAAAYAEMKDRDRAVVTLDCAIEIARSQGLETVVATLAAQRKQYEPDQPAP